MWERRGEVKDLTIRLCKEAVQEEDAEVIVPFCGVFVPFIVSPEEIEAEVGGPVINGMAVGLRVTEMFVNLDIHRSRFRRHARTPALGKVFPSCSSAQSPLP